MNVVDTHAHFWDPGPLRYRWIEKGSVFDRPYHPEDYWRAAAQLPVDRLIFVECDAHAESSVREARWVAQLARADARILGIVARVDLTASTNLARDVAEVAALPLVKGVRDNIQNNPAGFALQDSFIRGVQEVHERGLHFELCLKHHQLAETIELVKRCPKGRFVLDHCAKPDIQAGLREPWLTQMRAMAELPNVDCKISGLVTEADWERWRPEDVLWYAQQAAEVFGPSRILFGSDWPVNEVAGGFGRWFRLAEELAAAWSLENRRRFFCKNAERVYRLTAAAD
jgi:L-fuconolactonase